MRLPEVGLFADDRLEVGPRSSEIAFRAADGDPAGALQELFQVPSAQPEPKSARLGGDLAGALGGQERVELGRGPVPLSRRGERSREAEA